MVETANGGERGFRKVIRKVLYKCESYAIEHENYDLSVYA